MFKDLKYIANYYSLTYAVCEERMSGPWIMLIKDNFYYLNFFCPRWPDDSTKWYDKSLDNTLLDGLWYYFSNIHIPLSAYMKSFIVEINYA